MTVHATTLLTIALMASATYATRTLGFVLLADRTLSIRSRAVLDAAPACVLLAVIAPVFVAPRVADLVALAITVIAAMRLSMIATVCLAVLASAALRSVLG